MSQNAGGWGGAPNTNTNEKGKRRSWEDINEEEDYQSQPGGRNVKHHPNEDALLWQDDEEGDQEGVEYDEEGLYDEDEGFDIKNTIAAHTNRMYW